MRSLRFTLLLASFTVGGCGLLLACQGDDNVLPLPASDAGSSDAKAGDATVEASDSGHDAASKSADASVTPEAAAEIDATSGADAASDARAEVDSEVD
jgi:hypothetical protein